MHSDLTRGLLLPPPLFLLSGLVGEVLGGPPAPATRIDQNLVALALRHQVGPMLFAAAGRHVIAPELLQLLEQSYRASVRRRQSSLMRLEGIANQFARHGIDWRAIKGTTQAAQLYADPAWRDSADIDILVAPRDFRHALDSLSELGFAARYPSLPATPWLRKAILGGIRDITLIARDDSSCAIDLHRSILLVGSRHVDFLRRAAAPGSIPAPALGADLAFYLIAHGAISYWMRLKWLTDLVPLFAKLSDADCYALLARVQLAGAERATAASLLLLRDLFPFVALGPLQPWLADKAAERAVQRRLQRYRQMLAGDADPAQSPLNSKLMALEANVMFFTSISSRAQLFFVAPISSALRRLAGALGDADRALTLPVVPSIKGR